AASHHFRLDGVRAYSGGSVATALYPEAAAALDRLGFAVEKRGAGANPEHLVRYASGAAPVRLWSKLTDDAANPREHLVVLWNCPQADAECPVVPGAHRRFAILYDDPKSSDGTLREASTYDERAREIGRELLYLFAECAAKMAEGDSSARRRA